MLTISWFNINSPSLCWWMFLTSWRIWWCLVPHMIECLSVKMLNPMIIDECHIFAIFRQTLYQKNIGVYKLVLKNQISFTCEHPNQLTPYVQFSEPVISTPLAFVPSIKQNLLCISFSFSPDTRTGIPGLKMKFSIKLEKKNLLDFCFDSNKWNVRNQKNIFRE